MSYNELSATPEVRTAEPLPLPPGVLDAARQEAQPLELSDVLVSVRQTYPQLEVAVREMQVASGKELAAWGEFDRLVQARAISRPMGFYENVRADMSVTQPLYSGGYVYSGYRLGNGLFPPWYGERETDDGGEFRAGFGLPILQNRAIDERRSDVQQAALARMAVEPAVQSQLIQFIHAASYAYWSWVAAGQALETQRELLRLSLDRVEQIEERVRAGDLEEIARLNNQRLIASRETTLIEYERKLQQAAIKLSLFLRTPDGRPVIPEVELLPSEFPEHQPPDRSQLEEDITAALAARPEIAELNLQRRQVVVELAQAENMLLPKLDALLEASKDVGELASPKGDKRPFELEAGLYGEVPLQRRKARGKIESARAKIAQVDAKRQFTEDKIVTEVQDAYSALLAAAGRIELAATNLRLARESLGLARQSFQAGDIDVVVLNIYEQSVADARLVLIQAQADLFRAAADYRAALALGVSG